MPIFVLFIQERKADCCDFSAVECSRQGTRPPGWLSLVSLKVWVEMKQCSVDG